MNKTSGNHYLRTSIITYAPLLLLTHLYLYKHLQLPFISLYIYKLPDTDRSRIDWTDVNLVVYSQAVDLLNSTTRPLQSSPSPPCTGRNTTHNSWGGDENTIDGGGTHTQTPHVLIIKNHIFSPDFCFLYRFSSLTIPPTTPRPRPSCPENPHLKHEQSSPNM